MRERQDILAMAAAVGNQDNERGQHLTLASQPITQPGSNAGKPGLLRTGLQQCDTRIVIDRLSVHRSDHAELVDYLGRVGQQAAHPGATVASLGKLENGGRDWQLFLIGSHAGQPLITPHRLGKILTL